MIKKNNIWSWKGLWLPEIDIPVGISGIYFIQIYNGYIKIGQSSNISKRVITLRNASPGYIWLIGYIETNDLDGCEEIIFDQFECYQVGGEWFAPCKELVDYLRNFIDGIGLVPYENEYNNGNLIKDQEEAQNNYKKENFDILIKTMQSQLPLDL